MGEVGNKEAKEQLKPQFYYDVDWQTLGPAGGKLIDALKENGAGWINDELNLWMLGRNGYGSGNLHDVSLRFFVSKPELTYPVPEKDVIYDVDRVQMIHSRSDMPEHQNAQRFLGDEVLFGARQALPVLEELFRDMKAEDNPRITPPQASNLWEKHSAEWQAFWEKKSPVSGRSPDDIVVKLQQHGHDIKLLPVWNTVQGITHVE